MLLTDRKRQDKKPTTLEILIFVVSLMSAGVATWQGYLAREASP